MAPVINWHKPSDLQEQKCILLQFLRPDRGIKNVAGSRDILSGKALGKNPPYTLPTSGVPWLVAA